MTGFSNRSKKSMFFNAAFTLFLISAVASTAWAVTEKEWAVAINLAGRQRMLSQKMTKEYLLIALNINTEASKKELKTSMDLFNDTLDRLQKGDADLSIPAPPSPEMDAQLGKVKGLWDAFKSKLEPALQGTADAAAAGEIAPLSATLLDEANKAVSLYESESQKAGVKTLGKVINVAGRQRMLSQKMSKEILLIALGVDSAGNLASLGETKSLFEKSLAALMKGDSEMGITATSSPSILAQMNKVEALWKEFGPLVDQVISGGVATPELASKIAELSPKILAEMSRAVTMYEGEAAGS